jgi:hypothetical protein
VSDQLSTSELIAGVLGAEIKRLRLALTVAARGFELLAAGGVGMTNGVDPKVRAAEAYKALKHEP